MAKKKTFADEAKAITNKYKLRLGDKFDKGDTLALEAMNQELTALQQKQEKARVQKMVDGASPEQLSQLSQALSQSAQSQPQGQQPEFRGGGELPQYQIGGEFLDMPQINASASAQYGVDPYGMMGVYGRGVGQQRSITAPDPMTSLGGTGQSLLSDPVAAGEWLGSQPDIQGGGAGADQGFAPYESRVPWWGAVAQGVGALAGGRRVDLPGLEGVEEITAPKTVPRTVSYARGREQTMRERDLAQGMVRRSARGRGTQQGVTSATIAGATGTQRVAGSEFNRLLEQEQNVNAQIINRAREAEATRELQVGGMNQRLKLAQAQTARENEMINVQRKDQMYQGLIGAATGYGKDVMAADRYDQMLQMMTPENYQAIAGQAKRPRLREILGISDPMEMIFKDTGQRFSS